MKKLIFITIIIIRTMVVFSQENGTIKDYQAFKNEFLYFQPDKRQQIDRLQQKINKGNNIAFITCATAILIYHYAPASKGKAQVFYLGGVFTIASINAVHLARLNKKLKYVQNR